MTKYENHTPSYCILLDTIKIKNEEERWELTQALNLIITELPFVRIIFSSENIFKGIYSC
jgi:hypothetical protein